MLENTNLAAVQLPGQIRVYYQDKGFIKESCYDNNNGWYTRGKDIVTTNARNNPPTPIAAITGDTRANNEEIRVYYVNISNRICECIRTNDAGDWTVTEIYNVNVSTNTQLAVVRRGDEDLRIRVYYQSSDNKLHQLLRRNVWSDTRIGAPPDHFTAQGGSGLSAITDGTVVRLYYRDIEGTINSIRNTDGGWKERQDLNVETSSKASISAIAWKNSESKLQIHIFSIGKEDKFIRMTKDGNKEWDDCELPYEPTFDNSAIAAVCDSSRTEINVFYVSERNVIAQYKFNNERKRVPLGIPTTLSEATGLPVSTVATGLAYAVQKHPFAYSKGYPTLKIGDFKKIPPIQQGFTNFVGYSFRQPGSIYGGPVIDIQFIATNYRGFLYAKVSGQYAFTIGRTDNMTLIWIGPEAITGYEKENAFLVQDTVLDNLTTVTAKKDLKEGTLTPIRILAVNGEAWSEFTLTITAPDGIEILGKDPKPTINFLQFPSFPPFGAEV